MKAKSCLLHPNVKAKRCDFCLQPNRHKFIEPARQGVWVLDECNFPLSMGRYRAIFPGQWYCLVVSAAALQIERKIKPHCDALSILLHLKASSSHSNFELCRPNINKSASEDFCCPFLVGCFDLFF